MVDYLLNRPYPQSLAPFTFETGLRISASHNHWQLVEYFMNKKTERAINNLNAGLHGACCAGNVDMILYFLDKGANDIAGGITAALEKQTIENNRIDILKLLIEQANERGLTPLVFIWTLTATALISNNHGDLNVVEFIMNLIPAPEKTENFYKVCCDECKLINDDRLMAYFSNQQGK